MGAAHCKQPPYRGGLMLGDFNMLDFLKTVAPWLITALTGGPIGLAGMAAKTIADKIGLSDSTVDSVKAALTGSTMTPEQMLSLKQADDDFSTQMQKLGFTHAENMAGIQVQKDTVAAGDRTSARLMATAESDHTARNLAYMYTLALFAVIAAHLWIVVERIPVDPVAMNLISTLEGVLIAMVLGSKEFFFGSSSSAVKQQAAITDFATSPGTVSAPIASTTTVQTQSNPPQTVIVGPAVVPPDDLYKGA
jgi:hypothetical protein